MRKPDPIYEIWCKLDGIAQQKEEVLRIAWIAHIEHQLPPPRAELRRAAEDARELANSIAVAVLRSSVAAGSTFKAG